MLFHFRVLYWMQTEEQKRGRPGNEANNLCWSALISRLLLYHSYKKVGEFYLLAIGVLTQPAYKLILATLRKEHGFHSWSYTNPERLTATLTFYLKLLFLCCCSMLISHQAVCWNKFNKGEMRKLQTIFCSSGYSPSADWVAPSNDFTLSWLSKPSGGQ